MRILGIAFKASDATFCVVEATSDDAVNASFVDTPKKLSLGSESGDDETRKGLDTFTGAFQEFLSEHAIDAVAIKKRSKTGRYAGGGLTFKMETLVQLATDLPVHFTTPQALSAFDKKHSPTAPKGITKDQHPAWLAAVHLGATREDA